VSPDGLGPRAYRHDPGDRGDQGGQTWLYPGQVERIPVIEPAFLADRVDPGGQVFLDGLQVFPNHFRCMEELGVLEDQEALGDLQCFHREGQVGQDYL
jgi:hypothetical protein